MSQSDEIIYQTRGWCNLEKSFRRCQSYSVFVANQCCVCLGQLKIRDTEQLLTILMLLCMIEIRIYYKGSLIRHIPKVAPFHQTINLISFIYQ